MNGLFQNLERFELKNNGLAFRYISVQFGMLISTLEDEYISGVRVNLVKGCERWEKIANLTKWAENSTCAASKVSTQYNTTFPSNFHKQFFISKLYVRKFGSFMSEITHALILLGSIPSMIDSKLRKLLS